MRYGNDMVMAGRGFTIEEELATRGATLKIPAFTKNKKQMPAKDVHNSRKISFAFTWSDKKILNFEFYHSN